MTRIPNCWRSDCYNNMWISRPRLRNLITGGVSRPPKMLCNFQFVCVFQTNSLQTKAYHSRDRYHITVYDQVSKNFLFSLTESPGCIVYNAKFKEVSLVSPAKGHCRIVWNDLSTARYTHRSLCRLLITSTVLWSHLTDAAGVPLASHTRLTVLPYSPRVSGRRFDENIGASAKKQTTYCYIVCSTVTQLTSDFVAPGFYEKFPQANKRFLSEQDRNKNWKEHAQTIDTRLLCSLYHALYIFKQGTKYSIAQYLL